MRGCCIALLWLLSLNVYGQDSSLKGTVTDRTGEPLIGAGVQVRGTTKGTVTGLDGGYILTAVPSDAMLIVSCVGMQTQVVPVNGRAVVNVVLSEDSEMLEGAVAVGYGVQKKESIVGSIVQATSKDIRRSGNVTDLKQALTGQLPGVVTMTSSGEPGGTGTGTSATSIFIRGRNTWNGGQPLILVDGVERNMENVDISEVESISVLKDASATAVFGVKGANGVILISTKRGRTGKPELSMSYNATALMISKLPDKLDSFDARRLKNEMIEREVAINEASWADYTPYEILKRFQKPQSAENALVYPNVDWVDAMFKDVSMSHRTSLNVRGGTDFVNYFGAVSYLNEGDMFKKYDNFKNYSPSYSFNRFNFRTNLNFNLTRTSLLKVDLSGYFSQKNTNNSYHNENSNTNPIAWSSAYGMPPDAYLPQYADGRWGASYNLPAEALQNPVALIYNTGRMEYRTTRLNADFSFKQDLDFLTPGLSTEFSFFYDNSVRTLGGIYDVTNAVRPESGSNTSQKIVYPEQYTGPGQDPSEYTSDIPTTGSGQFDWVVRPWWIQTEGVQNNSIYRRMMYQAQVNYARKFGRHNAGAMGLFKREEYATGSEFKYYREDWVFRTTYDYDMRYLFEANGAYNGSEKFGPGYRFDFFPSVALGWYASNEKFYHIDWMNRLKLRYSVGLVGDDTGGGRWAYSSQYAYGGNSRMNANITELSPYTWYKETIVGNPDIHWEVARKQNFGAEVGLLGDMISLDFDYFTEYRSDMLVGGRRDIPSYFGASAPAANLGEVKSRGYEIAMKVNKQIGNVFLWMNMSLTHSRNKVTFTDDPSLLPYYQRTAGYPIGQSKSLIRTKFYSNWDEVFASTPTETNDLDKLPGYYHLIDFNADGVISSVGDTAPTAYPEVPENTYNFTIGAEYGRFSLMLQFFGVSGVSRYLPLSNYYLYQNVLFGHALDYWSKDNPNATSFLPRWKTKGENVGDYFLYDGSYLRLKTAELAYTFDERLLRKAGVSSLRVFVNGNNLLFWSRLPDDRENSWQGGSAERGTYPTPRRINFGFELTF